MPTNVVRLQRLVKVSVPGNKFVHGLNVERHNCDGGLEPPGFLPAFPWKWRLIYTTNAGKHGLGGDLLQTNTCFFVIARY